LTMSRSCQGLSYCSWSILIFGLFCISRNSAPDLMGSSTGVKAFEAGCIVGAVLLGGAAEVVAYQEWKKRRQRSEIAHPKEASLGVRLKQG